MATSNQALVRDNSTLTNFKQWAKAIDDFFTTAGWARSSDTGQVNWGTISTVPTSGNYVYAIWQPQDGLTTFYLKVEYGSGSGSGPNPRMRLSLSTATNGAGVLSGFVTNLKILPPTDLNVTSSVTQWQCYFSGDTGRMAVMMWRDESSTHSPVLFTVQRSLNASGSPTSGYVTLVLIGATDGYSNVLLQQTVVFGTGVTATPTSSNGRLNVLGGTYPTPSDLFNSNIAISPVFPNVGYFDNPMDILVTGASNDFTEGTQYTIAAGNMPYGISHTYIASKGWVFASASIYSGSASSTAVLMRYD